MRTWAVAGKTRTPDALAMRAVQQFIARAEASLKAPTQGKVAAILGIKQNQVSLIKSGRGCGLNVILDMARKTGASVDEILGLVPQQTVAHNVELVDKLKRDNDRLLDENQRLSAENARLHDDLKRYREEHDARRSAHPPKVVPALGGGGNGNGSGNGHKSSTPPSA